MNIIKSPIELKETVLQNVALMLFDRKYLDLKYKSSILKTINTKTNSDSITFSSDFDHPYNIHVKFLTEQNVGKKQNLVKLVDYTDKKNHYILIVIDDKVSKFLKDFKRISNIEIFDYDEFYFNVTDHILVPKHIILTEEEQQQILIEYNLSIDQVPKLFKTDRIARHYNMKVGSICKIEQLSPVTGKVITYRHIINNINA